MTSVRHVVIGTAGHIDHGKSALVLALTGTDPDRLKEEKARGITIDLGFAHWRTGDLNFAFVDVPGHERFVRNMLAGIGGIDAVLLVVAADESVMPQTREHFEICRLLRVPAGIVAITKTDLVNAEMVELVRLEVQELVRGSVLEAAPVVPVSARSGAGLPELRAALIELGRRLERRSIEGVPRLPIDRVFSMKGFGTVVTGTLVSGTLVLDQELVALPVGRTVKVRGLQVHGEKQGSVAAGQRAAVNLGGVDAGELARGDTLTTHGALPVTTMIDAAIELVMDARPLRHGARVRFHQGTAEIMGRVGVSSVMRTRTPGPGAAQEVGPGERAYVRLRLERPAVITRGDRFILRAYSPPATVAGGEVLDPMPPRSSLRTATGRMRFERLRRSPADAAQEDRAIAWMIEEAGVAGLPVDRLVQRAGIAPGHVPATIARLEERGDATLADRVLVSHRLLAALEAQLVELLRSHHQADPLAEGLAREEARSRVFGRAGPGVFERVVERLVAAGAIEVRDTLLALKGHRLSLSPDEQRALSRIEEHFRRGGLKPGDPATLAAELGVAVELADRMLRLLLRRKTLVRIDTLIFHESALARLKADVAALKDRGATTIDVATFKERYGITRKYAIPLLELLDRERITRRVGDVRLIL